MRTTVHKGWVQDYEPNAAYEDHVEMVVSHL